MSENYYQPNNYNNHSNTYRPYPPPGGRGQQQLRGGGGGGNWNTRGGGGGGERAPTQNPDGSCFKCGSFETLEAITQQGKNMGRKYLKCAGCNGFLQFTGEMGQSSLPQQSESARVEVQGVAIARKFDSMQAEISALHDRLTRVEGKQNYAPQPPQPAQPPVGAERAPKRPAYDFETDSQLV